MQARAHERGQAARTGKRVDEQAGGQAGRLYTGVEAPPPNSKIRVQLVMSRSNSMTATRVHIGSHTEPAARIRGSEEGGGGGSGLLGGAGVM